MKSHRSSNDGVALNGRRIQILHIRTTKKKKVTKKKNRKKNLSHGQSSLTRGKRTRKAGKPTNNKTATMREERTKKVFQLRSMECCAAMAPPTRPSRATFFSRQNSNVGCLVGWLQRKPLRNKKKNNWFVCLSLSLSLRERTTARRIGSVRGERQRQRRNECFFPREDSDSPAAAQTTHIAATTLNRASDSNNLPRHCF